MRTGPRRVLAGSLVVLGLAAATAFAQDATLTGTDGNDVITGTAAAETIYARSGDDTVNGGGGGDDLDGGPGADVLNGGEGSDSVAYIGSAGVIVSFDGVANDGAAGERDNIGIDVEDVFGADGPDKLDGSAADNTIDGGAGDDRITGGSGRDAIFGGDGDDVIDVRDGRTDRVECGAGNDLVTVDEIDIVAGDCEQGGTTFAFGLTLSVSRIARRMILSGIVKGSTLVIACARGCHPSSPESKALVRQAPVKLTRGTVRLPLTRRIAGARIEIGVTAPRARTRCRRYDVSSNLRKYDELTGACTTVARSRS